MSAPGRNVHTSNYHVVVLFWWLNQSLYESPTGRKKKLNSNNILTKEICKSSWQHKRFTFLGRGLSWIFKEKCYWTVCVWKIRWELVSETWTVLQRKILTTGFMLKVHCAQKNGKRFEDKVIPTGKKKIKIINCLLNYMQNIKWTQLPANISTLYKRW